VRRQQAARRAPEPSEAAAPTTDEPALAAGDRPVRRKRPLYPRLLRLRHVRPNGWQRAALGEGALTLAVVLVLADLASAWTLIVLPVGVAAIVKAHDLLAGLLRRPRDPEDGDGAGPRGGPAPSDAQD
jgi:hypothetical protein